MKRNLALDVLKVLLSVMVVALHAQLFYDFSPLANHFFVDGILRVAVPTFFIMNGYFLTNVVKDSVALKTWLKRFCILYVFWMVVYVAFWLPPQGLTTGAAVFFTVKAILVGYHHLWYISGLLVGAVILYFCSRYSDRSLAILAISAFLVGAALQYFFYYLYSKSPPTPLYRNGVFLGFPMIAIGYLIRKGCFANVSRNLQIAAIIAGTLLLLLETYLSSLTRYTDGRGFDIYVSLLILCPALFMFCIGQTRVTSSEHLSKLSSVIYFLHPLFISAAAAFLQPVLGMKVFFAAMGLCLLFYAPVNFVSRRLPFIF